MTATVIDGRKVADGLTSRIASAVADARAHDVESAACIMRQTSRGVVRRLRSSEVP